MKKISLLMAGIGLSFLSEEALAGACPNLSVPDINAIAVNLQYAGWTVTDSPNHPIHGQVFPGDAKVDLRAGSPEPGSCQYNVVVWPKNLNDDVVIGRFQIHKPMKK